MDGMERTSSQAYSDELRLPEKDHFDLSNTDRRLLEFIENNPGCTINEFKETFDWSHGSARYYRNKLVRRGLIYCDRADHPHRHYGTVSPLKPGDLSEMRLHAQLQDPRRAGILEWLREHRRVGVTPGGWVTMNRLVDESGFSRDYVMNVLYRFEEFNVVEFRRFGTRYQVRATESDEIDLSGEGPLDMLTRPTDS